MVYRIALIVLSICAVLSLHAQENTYISAGDTIHYAYTPQPTVTPKRPFFRRIVDYFGNSTTDRTFEKKIDITFAGGPSYSKNTSLGLGVLAAGLYRLDRTDSITSPSDISIYASASISGFYSIGVTGNTIFALNRRRVDYTVSFTSAPRSLWGIGYDAGRYNPESTFVEKRYFVQGRYRLVVLPNTFFGVVMNFEHAQGKKFTNEAYLYGERKKYTAGGVGLFAEYDSRDFAPNPYRGIYVSFQEIIFPKGLSNCGNTLWRSAVTVDYYQKLWESAILATDLYAEYNSKGTPWPMLARMGGSQRMRGYYQGRYTDNGMVTFQVELRQRIWRRIGCVVWGGAGNVFPTIAKYDWSHTLPNYGVGLRWELKKRVNVRFDYGLGQKTSGFLLNINEAF